MNIRDYLLTMRDGTMKQVNPITSDVVWYVPGRQVRFGISDHIEYQKLEANVPEDYCDFCRAHYTRTSPEKSRIVKNGNAYSHLCFLPSEQYYSTDPLFRRIGNLFEIVSFDFWNKNYDAIIAPVWRQWMDEYLSSPAGREHVETLLRMKLSWLGMDGDTTQRMLTHEFTRLATPLFGGWHDLIISARHYREDAQSLNELFFTGDYSPEEHYQLFLYTLETIQSIYDENPHARFAAMFQNWGRAAGASREHLHRQIMALDEWGPTLTKAVTRASREPRFFSQLAHTFANDLSLKIAENDFAVCTVETGWRYPAVAIYARETRKQLHDYSPEELRGISDLVHACHKGLGASLPTNEEWLYTPPGAKAAIPLQIRIKWRANITAGFEGETDIWINPVSPFEFRDHIASQIKKGIS